jgi:hypothetical protein
VRCRGCEYPLWGLKPGPCPECGLAFKPSDYRFFPGSVKFICPGCSQDYYGTSKDGHLEPSSFACVRCARALTMDEMVVEPVQTDPNSPTAAASPDNPNGANGPESASPRKAAPATPVLMNDVFPLTDTTKGWWSRLATTWWWSLASPARLLRSTPLNATTPAWWYFLGAIGVNWLVGLVLSVGMVVVVSAVMGSMVSGFGPGPGGPGGPGWGGPAPGMPGMPGMTRGPVPMNNPFTLQTLLAAMFSVRQIGMMIAGALLAVLFVVVEAGVALGVLRALGVRGATWDRTFQVYALTYPTILIGLVGMICCPLVLVAMFAPIVCACIAMPAAMDHLRTPNGAHATGEGLTSRCVIATICGGAAFFVMTIGWGVFASMIH